jgi:hypothetical protein
MASYILQLLSPQKVLDKLSSRLGSPSPARSNTPARSPAPSHASLTSRLSQPPHTDHARSGSETERESTHNSSSSHKHSVSMSSYSSSTTSPAASSQALDSPYSRLRHLSAPGSPNKARAAAAASTSSGSSHSPSRRRRHRASMASMSQLQLTDFSEEEDDNPGQRTATNTTRDRASRDRTLNERDLITQSALAAVASSRRSPLGNRRRAALPKEFRSDLVDDSPSPNLVGGGRHTVAGRYDSRRESSEKESWKVRNPHICYVFPFFTPLFSTPLNPSPHFDPVLDVLPPFAKCGTVQALARGGHPTITVTTTR